MRRQHDVAVLAAFALLDADQHTFAIDVGDSQRDDFTSAQAGAVGHAQRGLVLEPRRRIEQSRHLFRAQHHWQLARLIDKMRVLDDGVPLERNPEKEPQRRYAVIENRDLRAVVD